jgi:hypothetical protein
MEHPCPDCPEVLRSERAYNRHLAIMHESFSDGRDVSQATVLSLETKKDQTLFLLLKYPECRDPNNGELWTRVLQYFIGATLWDQNKQGVMLNAPEGVMPRQQWSHSLRQLEGYRRQRESLQEEDKKYHNEDGSIRLEHRCIRPSETQIALAEASERAHRGYFGKGKT